MTNCLTAYLFEPVRKSSAVARLLRIKRSKGDPEGQGATAYLSPRSVRAIAAWTDVAAIGEGALFRRVGVRRSSRLN